MTPDQVWFRLCKLDILKRAPDRAATPRRDEQVPEGDGPLVRLEDGTLKRLPVGEKSLAQQLREKGQPKQEGRRARRRRLKNEGR